MVCPIWLTPVACRARWLSKGKFPILMVDNTMLSRRSSSSSVSKSLMMTVWPVVLCL
jgi:hypothetical protein